MKDYREFTEEEAKWIKSFERVMRKAPSTLFMFVNGGGSMAVYTKDQNNNRYMNDVGSVDDNAPNKTISTPMETDGGDY